MSLEEDVLEILAYGLNEPETPADQKLYDALRLLCKHRSQLLAEEMIREAGRRVRSGPFEGMLLPESSSEGCFVPKLLGTYEQELHPIVSSFPRRRYQTIIDVGCAEGYYAVGLAKLLPDVVVEAYDIDPIARDVCSATAAENGVGDRVHVGERLTVEDFARHAGRRACVICDIEGDEIDLLDRSSAPDLDRMDLLVEAHDEIVPECSRRLRDRFSATHRIEELRVGGRSTAGFEELSSREHLDQLLAVWEWRLAGNGWLWMEAIGG